MKRTIVLLIVIASINIQPLLAQNTLAKIKFEDAEKAFNNANYEGCIKLLDETEAILGQSAPNILFLRILAGQKLLEADKNYPYSLLATVRDQTDFYLSNYDIVGLEEKYKQVYEVSKILSNYPEDIKAYQKLIEEKPRRLKAVIEEYIQAIGGREKLRSVNTVFKISKSTGDYNYHEKYQFPNNYTAYLTDRTWKRIRPWNQYVLSANEAYFSANKKTKPLSEDTKEALMENIKLNSFPELNFFNESYKLEFKEEGNDKGQDVISITYPDGKDELRYYNRQTHLLEIIVHQGTYFWSQEPVKSTVVYLADYKEVDGVKLPFNLRYVTIFEKADNYEWPVQYLSITINQNVTEADFRQ